MKSELEFMNGICVPIKEALRRPLSPPLWGNTAKRCHLWSRRQLLLDTESGRALLLDFSTSKIIINRYLIPIGCPVHGIFFKEARGD